MVNDPAWRPKVHPYFGYVYLPDRGAELHGFYVNNHAFAQSAAYVKENPQCCDFPARRVAKRDFIVGIFGGSVAASFAVTAQQAGDFQPIEGSNVRILNFASGGYKQPQQLLVLSYFLSLGQTFDDQYRWVQRVARVERRRWIRHLHASLAGARGRN